MDQTPATRASLIVKPANILLENGVEWVKLTDFGLARAAADAGLTQSGLVAGTPDYMAPEQARGESTDHRAELFSLGSTLYALCTGHPPSPAESAVAVLRRVSDDTPQPVGAIDPDVPEWLESRSSRSRHRSRSCGIWSTSVKRTAAKSSPSDWIRFSKRPRGSDGNSAAGISYRGSAREKHRRAHPDLRVHIRFRSPSHHQPRANVSSPLVSGPAHRKHGAGPRRAHVLAALGV